MDLPSATDQQLALAQASYDRCQKAPDFFRVFYNHFLSSDPAIPPYFTETRFDRQTRLLQHGISLLLVYAKRPNPHLMERLVERHGPGDLNIPARLYPFFVESFIATVREFDPDCGSATEEAWRTALAPGIALMTETQK
ncbi:MAG: globin [Gemmatimonadales bacterium]